MTGDDGFPVTTALLPPTAVAEALLHLGFLPPATARREDREGERIARYRLLAPVGQGAFGIVWSAAQTEPIQREIALKLIRRGMDSREIIARFEAESRALAMMDHPNIAAVLDAGTTTDGRPYFAMELVRGTPLTTYCDSRSLSVRERIELFIPVCQAVQHAHQKAILHRDLKPSNILVTEIDGRPVPKVIDFGIAKALGEPREALLRTSTSLLQTRAGAIVGTLQYMSPEQAGSVPDVDTRSDIYSLGIVLYELLTGQTPLHRLGDIPQPYDETLRRIRCEEAARPSACVPPGRLRRQLRGDLDWIVVKALEKDRRRRYETATALAADLQRHLRQEPVTAVAPTWTYQLAKFSRRHRVAFATAGLVSAALLTGASVSLWQAAAARRSRIAAEQSRSEAQENFAKARDAVDHYLSRVTDDPRLKQAGFHTLRKELLETAMPFYEGLSHDRGIDPRTRSDQAQALGRLADIYWDIGDAAKSAENFRRAIAIGEGLMAEFPHEPLYRESLTLHCNNFASQLPPEETLKLHRRNREILASLTRDFPDNDEYCANLSYCLVNLACALYSVGKGAEAKATFQQAIEISGRLRAKAPDDPARLSQLATARGNLAAVLVDEGDYAGAEAHYREAIAIFEKVVAGSPSNYSYRGFLGLACHHFASMLTQRNRPEESIEWQRRSIETERGTVADFPQMPVFRHTLGSSLHGLADSLWQLDRNDEAEAVFLEALGIFEKLRTEQPMNLDYRLGEGLSLDRLGIMRYQAHDWPAALAYHSRAIVALRAALALQPQDPTTRTAFRLQLEKRLETEVAAGEGPAALADALEWIPLLSDTWEDCEHAASWLARVLTLLPDQPGSDGASPAAQACAAEAVRLLRRACELGYPAAAELPTSGKFRSLRAFPGFMALRDVPPDFPDRSPVRFAFDYRHDDAGKRVWTHEGGAWTEQQPSGVRNAFHTVARRRIRGVPGTEIVRAGNAGLWIFVPDLDGPKPTLLLAHTGDGDWKILGEMIEAE